MRRLAVMLCCLLLCASARGEAMSGEPAARIDVVRPAAEVVPTPARPKLDDVFKSLAGRGPEAPSEPVNLRAVGVAAVAVALMATAIAQWKRRKVAKQKPPADHKKLLDEIARETGLSRRQLGRIEAAARSAGLSSPLVAAICPSVLLKMAGEARSGVDRSALASLSRQIARRGR